MIASNPHPKGCKPFLISLGCIARYIFYQVYTEQNLGLTDQKNIA